MSRQATTTNSSKNRNCQACGSRNLQTIEVAYLHSVRVNDAGNTTRSLFSAEIEPPERRSTIRNPVFTLISVASASLLIIPAFINDGPTDLQGSVGMFDAQVYVPSAIVGFIAFAIHFAHATKYNASRWAKEYVDWRQQKVCRDCGSVSSAPEIGHWL